MAEYADGGTLHQVYENTSEEKRAAAEVMEEAALRVTARRKKSRERARRDLAVVLLLLGITDEVPESVETHLERRESFWLLGRKTQFTNRSDDE